MAYTVKQVAAMSGVSVRALHFYDETGLLAPAYVGANGYRFYEEPQLLTLQQILFYRELGFELKQIKRILGRADFEQVAALRSHSEGSAREPRPDAQLDCNHRQNHQAPERNEENEESGDVCGLQRRRRGRPIRCAHHISCLDAATGKLIYLERLNDQFSASPVVGGDLLYF